MDGNHNGYFWSANFCCVFTLHLRLLLNEVSEVFMFSVKKADFTTWPDERIFKKTKLAYDQMTLGNLFLLRIGSMARDRY